MNAKELIELLEKCPQDLPIRFVNKDGEDEENIWLNDIEISETGQSGYEVEGEIRLLGSE